jgi:hypothetical protein
MTEQNSEEDVFSEYLKSKELHGGVSLEAATVTVEKRFFPSKNKTSMLSERLDNNRMELALSRLKNDKGTMPDLSENDIQYTIELAEEETEKPTDLLLDYDTIKSFKGTDTAVAVHEESGKPVCGRLKYAVRIEFNDELGQVQFIEKKFRDEEDAMEFADRLENSPEDFELVYDEGKLEVKAFHSSIRDSLKESLKEDSDFTMILLFGYIYWTFSMILIPMAFSISMIALMTLFGASHILATRGEHGSCNDEFSVENNMLGIPIEEPDNIETEKEVWVDAKMVEDSVVLESKELDTRWVFDVDDGVMSEEAIKFFDEEGKNALFEDKTRMVAKRTSSRSNAVEDVSGKWYIESKY